MKTGRTPIRAMLVDLTHPAELPRLTESEIKRLVPLIKLHADPATSKILLTRLVELNRPAEVRARFRAVSLQSTVIAKYSHRIERKAKK